MDKLTLIISPEARETLDWIRNERGGSVDDVEVIRRALGTERFILENQNAGGHTYLKRRWRRWKEMRLC